MDEPIWIKDEVVLAIHQRQLAEHGGSGGIRDEGLLASALARPKNLLAYSEKMPDLAALAAAYAVGIVKNHPFVDGNKRTGFVVCRTFLVLNRHDLDATQEDKYLAFVHLAEDRMSEQDLANWIRKSLKPSDVSD